MINQQSRSENIKNKIYLEQENVYKNSLKKQYFEIEYWKFKIEMISNMKNQETQKKNNQLIEMVCILRANRSCRISSFSINNNYHFAVFKVTYLGRDNILIRFSLYKFN